MTGKSKNNTPSSGTTEVTQAEPAKSDSENVTQAQTPKPDATKTPVPPAGSKDKSKKSSNGVLIFLLLLILAALAVGGYFAWTHWQTYQSAQNQRLQSLENALAEQAGQVQAINSTQREQVGDQLTLLEQLQENQSAIEQRLDSHTQRLRELAGTSRDDWLLAEARYLLRLATQRLLVERGTEGAAALLSSADKILQSVDDASLLAVRNAIANEVIALKLAKTIDRQGLYLQLSAIKNQIQALPMVPFRPQDSDRQVNDQIVSEIENTPSEQVWYRQVWQSIASAFSNLDRFVKIRQHDEAPDLLISETQQMQIMNQLSLMLEQAQFALLHEEEMIYRSSLEEAKKNWSNYFSHYDQYEVIRNELSELQQRDIIQQLPDISRSSKLLTDFIERFHTLNTEEKPSAEPATTDKPNTEKAPEGPQS